MRDDARAGLQREKPRLHLLDQLRQQVHRHDGRGAEIGLEHVALAKHHAVRDAGAPGVLRALLYERRIDLYAEAARPVVARRGDDDTAVPGSQVDHQVVGTHIGNPQHLVHRDRGGGNVGRRDVGVGRASGQRGRKQRGEERGFGPILSLAARTYFAGCDASTTWRGSQICVRVAFQASSCAGPPGFSLLTRAVPVIALLKMRPEKS